jgi:hypothetical protein
MEETLLLGCAPGRVREQTGEVPASGMKVGHGGVTNLYGER